MKIEMRQLRLEDSEQVAQIHQVMKKQDNFNFMLSDYLVGEDFGPYIERVNAYKDEASVPEGKVVSTFFVAVIDGKFAGRLWWLLTLYICEPMLTRSKQIQSRCRFRRCVDLHTGR